MPVYTPFYITCSTCNHKNRPHKSPREGVRMALLGTVPPCRGCGKVLKPKLSDRPLVQKIRAELIEAGLLQAETPAPLPTSP